MNSHGSLLQSKYKRTDKYLYPQNYVLRTIKLRTIHKKVYEEHHIQKNKPVDPFNQESIKRERMITS